MIASLRGTLLERGDGWCVVEAGGVGYLAHVSTHTLAALPPAGDDVRLRTRQVVREDAVLLFGFADAEELRLFDLLIAVSGVGPRIALAALSGLRPAAMARAIRDENLGALVAIPGIGRKTAERLVLELRDKLEFLPDSPRRARSEGGLPAGEKFDDAVAALMTLGWNQSQAREAIRTAAEGAREASLEDLVRRALSQLGRAVAVTR